MGVRGAAVRHITMSDTAMLHTNRFMPVCSAGVLDTERDMDADYVINQKNFLSSIELCFVISF